MMGLRRAPGGATTRAAALLAVAAALAWADCVLAAAPATARPAAEAGAAPASTPIPADPAVRRGVLANGLRYAVMRVAAPAGSISLRLGIDAGSYEETDDERGFAHLIEHMAFRATRAFPDNAIDGAFASRGVAFGRDINAETGLFSTQFKLDLPHAKPEDLALGLRWLREVADGVVFETDGLDKERGVVLAEMEATKSPQSLAEEALTRFQAPDLRSTDRDPLGTQASVRGAAARALRAFYERWYRPQDAMVVIAGDLPVEALEARVRETFGTWRADGPAPTRAPRRPPDAARGLEATALDKAAILHTTKVCRLGAPDPRGPDTLAGVRREALRDIWRQILDNRLVDLKSDPANRLIEASTAAEDNGGDLRATCLVTLPVEGGWAAALRAGERELLRFENAGPTELEVETATDRVRSRLRGAVTAAPNRTAAELASSIVERGLDGEDLIEPRQALKAFDLAVEDLTVADVRAAFALTGAAPGR